MLTNFKRFIDLTAKDVGRTCVLASGVSIRILRAHIRSEFEAVFLDGPYGGGVALWASDGSKKFPWAWPPNYHIEKYVC